MRRESDEHLSELKERIVEIEQEIRGTPDKAGIDEIIRDLERQMLKCSRVVFGTDSPLKDDGIVGSIREIKDRLKALESAEDRKLTSSGQNKLMIGTIVAGILGVIASWMPLLLK